MDKPVNPMSELQSQVWHGVFGMAIVLNKGKSRCMAPCSSSPWAVYKKPFRC